MLKAFRLRPRLLRSAERRPLAGRKPHFRDRRHIVRPAPSL